MFSTAIEENIAYARPGAAKADIVAAAKAANAHAFIEALPHGYQSRVGERGMCLSGGERQRLPLAPAALRAEPVVGARTAFRVAPGRATLEGCDVLRRVEGGRARQEHPEPVDLAAAPALE